MSARTAVPPPASALRRALFAAAGLSLALAGVLSIGGPSAEAAGTSGAFTGSVTATRTNLVGGVDQQVDSRTVTVAVDRTANLQDQQVITVSWKGAHPSANTSVDPNADSSDNSEYPMVLLQCRDTGSTSLPAAKRVTPQTCWAPLGDERVLTTNAAGGEDNVGNYPAWRLDRYASAADKAQFAGVPTPATADCPASGSVAQRAIPFLAADGTKYYGSGLNKSCGASPPEAASYSQAGTVSALPDNAAFVPTHTDGTGTYEFNVRDAKTNASLGCSATVACSLVAIPIIGISCDTDVPNDPDNPDAAGNAAAQCEKTGSYPAGSTQRLNSVADLAVSGKLWWAESNWRNRIVVPLTFAPSSEACDDLTSSGQPPTLYGSELMIQATTQWSTKLCLTKGATTFKHVQAAEPLSRNLVATGGVQGALTSYAPTTPFTKPTVQAPVAATGFSISYNIDDKNGNPYSSLKLTPRLLAKLMTESYPSQSLVSENYTYGADAAKSLKNNPLNITQDPEFQALNPSVGSFGNGATGVNALLSISSQSDVLYALTSYINADPEARAWLDGTPDPWGMVVNPNYKGISLPVNTWPLSDTWSVPAGLLPRDLGTCEAVVDPQPPYLPLVAGPSARLADIAQSVQYGVPGDANACSVKQNLDGTLYLTYTRAAKQFPGHRFVIGVTSLGDAARYSLKSAALESSSSVSATATYTDATGRTFVQPTDASLKAAFDTMTRNSATGVWDLDYRALRSNTPSAYPGAMLVYADVPTTGLSGSVAAGYASVLAYMIGAGQDPGTAVGDLPAGFLPITSANGLAAQRAYTAEAISDVKNQQGLLPGQKAPSDGIGSSSGTASPATSGTATNPTGATSDAGTGSDNTGDGGGSASPTPSASASGSGVATASPTAPASSPALRSLGKTVGARDTSYQNLLVLLIALLLLGPVLVPATILANRWRGRR